MEEEVHFAGSPLDEYLNQLGGEFAGSGVVLRQTDAYSDGTRQASYSAQGMRALRYGSRLGTLLASDTAAKLEELFTRCGFIAASHDTTAHAEEQQDDDNDEANDHLGIGAPFSWQLIAQWLLVHGTHVVGATVGLAIYAKRIDRSFKAFHRGAQLALLGSCLWSVSQIWSGARSVIAWWDVWTHSRVVATSFGTFWSAAEGILALLRTSEDEYFALGNVAHAAVGTLCSEARRAIHREETFPALQGGAHPGSQMMPAHVQFGASLSDLWELHAALLEHVIQLTVEENAAKARVLLRNLDASAQRAHEILEKSLKYVSCLEYILASRQQAADGDITQSNHASSMGAERGTEDCISTDIQRDHNEPIPFRQRDRLRHRAHSALCLALWSFRLGLRPEDQCDDSDLDDKPQRIEQTSLAFLIKRLSSDLDAAEEAALVPNSSRPPLQTPSSTETLAYQQTDDIEHLETRGQDTNADGASYCINRQLDREPTNATLVHESVGAPPDLERNQTSRSKKDDEYDAFSIADIEAQRNRKFVFRSCLHELQRVIGLRSVPDHEETHGLQQRIGMQFLSHSQNGARAEYGLETFGEGPELEDDLLGGRGPMAMRSAPGELASEMLQALEARFEQRRNRDTSSIEG